jgi:hypothetical protein
MNSLVFTFAISGAIIIDLLKFILIVVAFGLTASVVGAPAAPAFYAASKAVGIVGSIYSGAFIIMHSGITKYRNHKNANKIIEKMGLNITKRVGVSSIAGLIPVIDIFPWCCYSVYVTCRDREKLDSEMSQNKSENYSQEVLEM